MEALGGIGGFSGGLANAFVLGALSRSPKQEEKDQGKAPVSAPGQEEAQDNSPQKLTPEEEQKVQELRQRDREVKNHEQAHVAASGSVAVNGPNYEYEKGPDGKMYAVGGHVQIDTSKAEDPEATLDKARQIQAAATAPAQPSAADRKVAGKAAQMESEARQELSAQENGTAETDKFGLKIEKNQPDQGGSQTARLEQDAAAWEMRMAAQAYEQNASDAMAGKVALHGLSLAV